VHPEAEKAIGALVDSMDRFFEQASAERGPRLTVKRLGEIFRERAGAECRERLYAILQMGREDPDVIPALAEKLKEAADGAHPELT
jgi:hypothetical protein